MENIIDEYLWQGMVSAEGFSGEVRFMERMDSHTSLRIGGPADVFVIPQDTGSMKYLIDVLTGKGIPFIPVGGGTNLLVKDGGIDGVVISLRNFRRSVIMEDKKDSVLLLIEAGVPLQRLVVLSKESGYSGVEGLVGVPGTVGGAVAGNAGAFGYSMKDVLVSVNLVSSDRKIVEVGAEDLCMGYRSSKMPEGAVILSANIRLRKDDREDVIKRIDGFFREKRDKQPLSEWSAGCVFKNPEGTSAGKLIDEAHCKGMRIGDVEVSTLHANFFINKGRASASDFIRLMDEVREKVMKVFNIELEPEIRIVGRE